MRREHGQAAALTVLFMTVLLASAAAVIDVGSWFREDRDTQRVADAAALAGAQALPYDQNTARSLAIQYGGKNGGGVAAANVSFTTTVLPGDTINVNVSKPAQSFFAKVVGIDSVQVGSTAKARAGNPTEARWAAPFTVDEQHPLLQCSPQPCFGQSTRLEADKVGPGAWHWMNVDGSRGGTGVPTLEEWIRHGYDGYMPLGWYYSMPGGKRSVDEALQSRVGTELLLPVFRDVKGNGANLEYEIVAWVGFRLTGFSLQGSKNSWLDGYFTRVIWDGILGSTGGSADFGVRSVALID